MTREERIEAAAKIVRDAIGARFGAWLSYTSAERLAAEIVGAAFPELMSDPPTAWVAPIAQDYGTLALMHANLQAARDAYTRVVEVGDADASAG